MRQKAAQLLNQNNVSPELRSAWQTFQQRLPNMTDKEIHEYPATLGPNLGMQLGGLITQVYGDSMGSYLRDIGSNPKIQKLLMPQQ